MGMNQRPKWILAAAAGVVAASMGGAVYAGASDDGTRDLPDVLRLQDARPVAAEPAPEVSTPTFNLIERPILRADQDSVATSTVSVASLATGTADSVITAPSPASAPSANTASPDSPVSPDSPDTVDTVSLDSPDSPDSI